jgi:NAD(P)H dehydrogenase (quinone)
MAGLEAGFLHPLRHRAGARPGSARRAQRHGSDHRRGSVRGTPSACGGQIPRPTLTSCLLYPRPRAAVVPWAGFGLVSASRCAASVLHISRTHVVGTIGTQSSVRPHHYAGVRASPERSVAEGARPSSREAGNPSMEPVNVAIIYYSATGTVHLWRKLPPRPPRRTAPRSACARSMNWPQKAQSPPTRRGVNTSAKPPRFPRPLPATWPEPMWSSSAPPPGSAPRPASSRRSSTPPGTVAERPARRQGLHSLDRVPDRARWPRGYPARLSHVFYHWGGIIVPPGYTDPIQFTSGNPYSTAHGRYRVSFQALAQFP